MWPCLLSVVLVLNSAFAQAGLAELSDEIHYSESGVHNPKFDHEAFLGKELAAELKSESFDDNKKRLVEIFSKIDTDKNGTVSEPEMYEWIKKVAKESLEKDAKARWNDLNPEGKESLSFVEYLEAAYGNEEKMPKEGAYWEDYVKYKNHDKKRWEVADLDKDGRLSFEEFKAMIHPEDFKHMRDIVVDETLENIDTDKDGFISTDEYLNDVSRVYGSVKVIPGEPRPDWALKEAENFDKWRDRNHDGKMDREEIAQWVVPDNYDPYEAEMKHLFYHADSNRDNQLSIKEMLDNQNTFVGSQATNYGKLHSDEL